MADKQSKKTAPKPPLRRAKYDPVRAECIRALGDVLDRGRKADDVISGVMQTNRFTELDRRFFLQLFHGVVKLKARLDHTFSFYLNHPDTTIDRRTRNILRLGLYQLIYTDRIPHGAAVSESVNLARGMVHHTRGAFVNAILRNYLRNPEKVVFPSRENNPVAYLALYYSYPEWFVEYCIKEFGIEETENILARGNRPPAMTYRHNPLKCSREQLEEILNSHAVPFENGEVLDDFYVIKKQGLPLERELIDTGYVYVQDQSAGIPVRLLNPQAGSHVLDLGAAPGGKSTYAAMRMGNQGMITAVDLNQARLETLVGNSQRLGTTIIAPVLCDILDFKGPKSSLVLLDALCSGWGVVSRHSDLRWAKSKDDIAHLAKLQAALILHSADLVKPGGMLVYSTCTIMRDENDQIVEEFLLKRPDFMIDPPGPEVPAHLVNERGFIKTYPQHDSLDGAFCARLKKKVGRNSKNP